MACPPTCSLCDRFDNVVLPSIIPLRALLSLVQPSPRRFRFKKDEMVELVAKLDLGSRLGDETAATIGSMAKGAVVSAVVNCFVRSDRPRPPHRPPPLHPRSCCGHVTLHPWLVDMYYRGTHLRLSAQTLVCAVPSFVASPSPPPRWLELSPRSYVTVRTRFMTVSVPPPWVGTPPPWCEPASQLPALADPRASSARHALPLAFC